MATSIRSGVVALIVVMLAQAALAQDKPVELTPAGKAILADKLSHEGRPPFGVTGPGKPLTFPMAMCTFPGGLCGAVRRDGSVAVSPHYDWVGTFSDQRAAVRIGGLYGFIDGEGREIVAPKYRIVDDYRFGFAQVDIDGKSGLIDRDGRMVIEPKYAMIRAIAPDRFAVAALRRLGGSRGGADFSSDRIEHASDGSMRFSVFGEFFGDRGFNEVIDITGRQIEPPIGARPIPFDKDDSSIRWVRSGELWGLARDDGSWLIEPKFQQVGSLADGLARVTVDRKIGFIDRSGNFVIPPNFDRANGFRRNFDRMDVTQDGVRGVIDRTGAWVFRTGYQELYLAIKYGFDRGPDRIFGWHFKNDGRWGLLNLDGKVILDAEFDQRVDQCGDGRLEGYKNKEWFYFRADGSPLQPPDSRLIGAGCYGFPPPYVMKRGEKFTLVDADSNPVTPLQFDAIAPLGSGEKNVKLDGKWGRIGPDGRWLLEPKFDYLNGGLDIFVASIDGKRGFMRPDGSWVITPKFDAARRRDGETAFVTLAGATGVLRLKDESWVIPPRRGVMCDVRHAIMLQTDDTRALLSPAGDTWIDIRAERIGIDLELGLLTFLRDGKWGLVDTAGQVMITPQYDEPVSFISHQRGVAWGKRDGKWCAIDRRGRAVPDIPCTDTNPWPSGRFACTVEP